MILKAVGCLLVLVSSVSVSLYLGSRGKQILRAYAEAELLIRHIKRSIETYLTPLNSILASYSSDYLEGLGFADAMRSEGLCAAFSRGYLPLPDEAEALLIDFSAKLGGDFAESEIKRCELCLGKLQELEASAREKLSKNSELYRVLPPLGAISIIIILL